MARYNTQTVAICTVLAVLNASPAFLVHGLVAAPGAPAPDVLKRQILSRPASIPVPAPSISLPASAVPSLGGLTSSVPVVGGSSLLGGVLGGSSSPLGAVTGGVTGAVGGLTGGASPLSGAASTLSGVTSPLSGAASPLSGVTSPLSGAVSPLSGVTSPLSGATSPLSGVTNAVSGATNAASGAVGSIGGAVAPVLGAVAPVLSSVPSNLNPPPFTGIPGTDPVGAFSISVIATLLSLLKKDPLSLFAPSLPIGPLVKRDLPELHRAGIPELAKRQLSGLPSLSSGIGGVGVGSLPLSGVPGIPPDLAFLVGSIAKNIAIPGGNGLGSVTSGILSALNGVVPNFLFQLPVVQDSVPTFGVLQLLAAINPSKFRDLASLNSLAALQQAASTISSADLNFVRSLPASPDPNNLISTIMTLSDNILSLPGSVTNLRASISVLCMKNLGLAVPGF